MNTGSYHEPPKNAWKKGGPSPNPGGRPRGSSLLHPWLRLLAANPNEEGEGRRAASLAETLLSALEEGNAPHAKVLLEALKITDPQVKHIEVSALENGGARPIVDEDEEPE